MGIGGYAQIAVSSFTIYIFIIVAIRLFGKKELSQLSVVDLVFILLISNAVQNAMVGPDNTLAGGIVAAGTLFITNFIFKYVLYRFPKFGRMIQGEAILLIYKGRLNHKNMARAKLNLDEIREVIREHGVLTIEDVDLAVLEIDGNISVLSHDYGKRTVRKKKSHKVLKKSESQ